MMKNKNIFVLSAIFLLTLSACAGNKSSEEPAGPAVTPTLNVAFNDIEDTCMVPSYVKAYIDAMKEQEGRITYMHRLDPLFCNMDWETAAKQADKGDGTTYADKYSGGVDVCQMLNCNQKYENIPIKLTWDKGDQDFSDAKIVFWSKKDQSDKREVAVEKDGASAKLPNLFRSTKYYFQLVKGEEASQMENFVTDDYTRMITMGDISNVRDMGGYMTSYGVRTNQGLIYRGGEMAVKAFADGMNQHSKNWTDAAQKVQKEVLNIGLELDLRTKSGSGTMTESPLEFTGEWNFQNTYPNKDKNANENNKAQYVRCAINSYDSFITDPNRSGESDNKDRNLVREIFNYLANADKQHVFFHCWGGADRTGVLGFLLNAICGVSYTDCIIDFELTTLTNNKRCHMHNSSNAHMPKFLLQFQKENKFTVDGVENTYTYDAEKTINYNATNLLVAMGVSLETIEKIRTIMVPGYTAGMEEVEGINKPAQS